MLEPLRVPVGPDHVCTCVLNHSPRPLDLEQHHVFPIYLQQKIWPEVTRDHPRVATLMDLCGTTHNNVHIVIDAMLAGKSTPKTTKYALQLAMRGLNMYFSAGGKPESP